MNILTPAQPYAGNNASAASPDCRICSSTTQLFGTATVLHKYDVQYFRCSRCRFVQTEDPYWLDEAYASPIAKIDLGVVNRSITLAQPTRTLLLTFFDCAASFVDYGAGYGIFVRRMRDLGFDFYHSDKYCENMFAAGFEVDTDPARRYELVTAFEVFEHLVDPMAELERIMQLSDSIFFTTLLVPSVAPKPGDWWYYVLDYGQHVSLYSLESLQYIANNFGLNLYSDGRAVHLLTKKRLSSKLFKAVLHPKLGRVFDAAFGWRQVQRSLLEDDFYSISGMRLE